ncbi:MAG TPA: dienelactone hydrolase family protein [Bryobacteraceae bacterium]|nr:dienelactone hydrolase family protein [Bryobacteraceae bacterium]
MQRITLVLLAVLSAPAIHAQGWAKAKLEKSPRHHEQVRIKADGREIPAFIVYPEAKTKRPAILLIPDKAGVTDWFKSFADEVAGMGYVVLAPAITDESHAMADLNAAADYGQKLPASNGMLFAAGIGWGGTQSFRFAGERADLAAALVFCGASPDKDSIAKIKGSVFGFYAGNDPAVNATVPPAQAAAKAAGVVFEAVTYKDVGPGFLESGDAPDAKPADKLARGYAIERMKSVLDMVSLRGY